MDCMYLQAGGEARLPCRLRLPQRGHQPRQRQIAEAQEALALRRQLKVARYRLPEALRHLCQHRTVNDGDGLPIERLLQQN